MNEMSFIIIYLSSVHSPVNGLVVSAPVLGTEQVVSANDSWHVSDIYPMFIEQIYNNRRWNYLGPFGVLGIVEPVGTYGLTQ